MRGLRLTLTLFAATATMAAGVGVATAGLGPNPANQGALLDEPIEGYDYDGAERCTKRVPPGTKAMVHWLERHTSGEFWGIGRCERFSPGSFSLHAENRAID